MPAPPYSVSFARSRRPACRMPSSPYRMSFPGTAIQHVLGGARGHDVVAFVAIQDVLAVAVERMGCSASGVPSPAAEATIDRGVPDVVVAKGSVVADDIALVVELIFEHLPENEPLEVRDGMTPSPGRQITSNAGAGYARMHFAVCRPRTIQGLILCRCSKMSSTTRAISSATTLPLAHNDILETPRSMVASAAGLERRMRCSPIRSTATARTS